MQKQPQQTTLQETTGDFASLGLHADLLRAVADLGFTRPTAIQAQAIPPTLAGRDVLGCAMTGSGKTAAFLLPILERLRSRPNGTTRALVLTPTRELAAQTVEQFEGLARHTRLRAAAVYGGMGMAPQTQAFRRGIDLIAATPGRLLDHFQYDYAHLRGLEVLVLDEADRMLDMGFLPDIRRVLRHLPQTPRQTLLFSATMPRPILELARELMRDPMTLGSERRAAPAIGISQALFPVPAALKPHLLLAMLRARVIGNVIVFCRTKHRANRLADRLERMGVSAARIHGNRSQAQRTKALDGFKAGHYRVLVATDVVARGIDVDALDHVLNFDVPEVPDAYIHRVGRTGRAEATGEAFTLVSPEEEGDVRAIERVLGRRIERRRIEGFDYNAAAAEPLEIPLNGRSLQRRSRSPAREGARRTPTRSRW
jgi:ATP-dependent RNA helicase RhlE